MDTESSGRELSDKYSAFDIWNGDEELEGETTRHQWSMKKQIYSGEKSEPETTVFGRPTRRARRITPPEAASDKPMTSEVMFGGLKTEIDLYAKQK